MDKKNLKPTIAREVLIALGIVIVNTLGFIYVWFGNQAPVSHLMLTTWRNWLLSLVVHFYILYIPYCFIKFAVVKLMRKK